MSPTPAPPNAMLYFRSQWMDVEAYREHWRTARKTKAAVSAALATLPAFSSAERRLRAEADAVWQVLGDEDRESVSLEFLAMHSGAKARSSDEESDEPSDSDSAELDGDEGEDGAGRRPNRRLLCPVCDEPLHRARVGVCGHTVCAKCASHGEALTCPECREVTAPELVTRNWLVEELARTEYPEGAAKPCPPPAASIRERVEEWRRAQIVRGLHRIARSAEAAWKRVTPTARAIVFRPHSTSHACFIQSGGIPCASYVFYGAGLEDDEDPDEESERERSKRREPPASYFFVEHLDQVIEALKGVGMALQVLDSQNGRLFVMTLAD